MMDIVKSEYFQFLSVPMYDEDTRKLPPVITSNSLSKTKTTTKPMERSIKMSFDNFESILVAWLHAVGEFNDNDEPSLIDFEYDEYDDSMLLKFEVEDQRQMKLPFGDPLGR